MRDSQELGTLLCSPVFVFVCCCFLITYIREVMVGTVAATMDYEVNFCKAEGSRGDTQGPGSLLD
jgi:hypothetical protein